MNRRPFSNVDFAYWLQGAIEIDELSEFTDEQVKLIRRRLNNISQKDAFSGAVWLALAVHNKEEAFEIINKELQKKFIHDIDPSYDGDQEHFQNIHDGKL